MRSSSGLIRKIPLRITWIRWTKRCACRSWWAARQPGRSRGGEARYGGTRWALFLLRQTCSSPGPPARTRNRLRKSSRQMYSVMLATRCAARTAGGWEKEHLIMAMKIIRDTFSIMALIMLAFRLLIVWNRWCKMVSNTKNSRKCLLEIRWCRSYKLITKLLLMQMKPISIMEKPEVYS